MCHLGGLICCMGTTKVLAMHKQKQASFKPYDVTHQTLAGDMARPDVIPRLRYSLWLC